MKNKTVTMLSKSKIIFASAFLAAGILLSSTNVFAAEEDDATEETAEGEEAAEGEDVALALEAAPSYDIPDNASFVYEDVEYKPIDHYDPSRAPMNGEPITVNYKGAITPAYYWAPGDMVVFQVSLADEDIPKFEELSQEDQDTWKSFLNDSYKTPEEAYYAEMLPTYTFSFNFEENKIEPFVEFDFGKDGKVVMMPYDKENQGFYLEELSPSFLKLGNFEFATYQFLTINDDTCYHILSCMDQVGNVYLYQYDANGNSCARADLNMLIGLRYLAERTVALNEYIDKVQWYQDIVRKIIAGLIIAAVVAVFAVILAKFGRKKDDDDDFDDEELEEDEDGEQEEIDEVIGSNEAEKILEQLEAEEKKEKTATPIPIELDLENIEKEYLEEEEETEEELPEIKIEEPKEDDFVLPEIELEPEALLDDNSSEEEAEENEIEDVEAEDVDLSAEGFTPDFEDDSTEGGLFYAADTDEMKSLFKEPADEPKKRGGLRAYLNGDDLEDDEDEDDDFFDDEDEEEEISESVEATEEELEEAVEELSHESKNVEVVAHEKKSLASIFDDEDEEDEEEEEKPRRVKKEKVKKEKVKKEKKVKEKPEKKRRKYEEDDDEDEVSKEDDDLEILDLNDL